MFVIAGAIISLTTGIILEFYWPGNTPAVTIRKCGSIAYAITACIPIPVIATTTWAHVRQPANEKMTQPIEKSVKNSMVAKVVIVVVSATLLTVGAVYRLGTLWVNPAPNEYPWYLSRESFYAFNFGIELFLVWFWLILRVDEPCITPDRANAPADHRRSGNMATRLSVNDLTRRLVSFQKSRSYAQRRSRFSWASGRCTRLSTASHATWGAASSEASDEMDKDFEEVLMYYTDEEISEIMSDCDTQSETSWGPINGQWALRPASGLLPCYMR